jgi:hypothetical protein
MPLRDRIGFSRARPASTPSALVCACALFVLPAAATAAPPAAQPQASPDTVTAQPGAAPAPSTARAAQARYDALVAQARKGDAPVDMAELRRAFTETPAYHGTMMSVYQSLWAPLGKGDFPAALRRAESVLDGNYVEVNAHMVASIAHQQLGNAARSAYHQQIANGLLRAIMATGDGASPQTPWVVIDMTEEYALLRVLNLSLRSQALSTAGGVSMDVLHVIDARTNEPRTIYINVDNPMAAMRAAGAAPRP